MRALSVSAGLAPQHVGMIIRRHELNPNAGVDDRVLTALARAGGVRREWLAEGIEPMLDPAAPPPPKATPGSKKPKQPYKPMTTANTSTEQPEDSATAATTTTTQPTRPPRIVSTGYRVEKPWRYRNLEAAAIQARSDGVPETILEGMRLIDLKSEEDLSFVDWLKEIYKRWTDSQDVLREAQKRLNGVVIETVDQAKGVDDLLAEIDDQHIQQRNRRK